MPSEDPIVDQALDLIDNMSKAQIIRVLQHIPGMHARTFKKQIRLTYHAPIQRSERKVSRRRIVNRLHGVRDIIGE